MAISTQFPTFHSSKPPPNPSTVTLTGRRQTGTHSPAKPLEKKQKTLTFFRRLSARFAPTPQHRRTTAIDPSGPASSDLAPSLSLGKHFSHDPVLASSGSSSPTGHQSYKSALPSLSLSCDEIGSLNRPKQDPAQGSPTNTHGWKTSPSRTSRFLRKRLSLSPSAPEPRSLTQEVAPASRSSDGHLSSIMSSTPSSAVSSANETGETSLASVDEPEPEECGLAGIGVRNRMSVSLYSLPIPPGLSPQLAAARPPVRPGLRYAPSSSSPLSASLAPSPVEDRSATPSPSFRPLSSQSQRPPSSLFPADQRLRFAHLGLVPNQTTVDSQTLMRILRGPSSYPDETLPRADSPRESLYVSCA